MLASKKKCRLRGFRARLAQLDPLATRASDTRRWVEDVTTFLEAHGPGHVARFKELSHGPVAPSGCDEDAAAGISARWKEEVGVLLAEIEANVSYGTQDWLGVGGLVVTVVALVIGVAGQGAKKGASATNGVGPAQPGGTRGGESSATDSSARERGPAPGPVPVYAFWFNDGETYRTELVDQLGRKLGTCGRIVVGTETGAWEVVLHERRVVLPDGVTLEELDESAATGGWVDAHPTRKADTQTADVYVRRVGNPTQVKRMRAARSPVDGNARTIRHSYEILGGYGSFLFVRDNMVTENMIAAHGSTLTTFQVLDLAAPDPSVTLYQGHEDSEPERAEGFLSARELRDAVEVGRSESHPLADAGSGMYQTEESGMLVGYYPTYPGRQVAWEFQFAWAVSHADSDELWERYTASAFVRSPEFRPAAVADLPLPPLELRPSGFKGWSVLDRLDPRVLADLAYCDVYVH